MLGSNLGVLHDSKYTRERALVGEWRTDGCVVALAAESERLLWMEVTVSIKSSRFRRGGVIRVWYSGGSGFDSWGCHLALLDSRALIASVRCGTIAWQQREEIQRL